MFWDARNSWYIEGLSKTMISVLPSGREIQIFSPLYLLASKIEAFLGRGNSFYFSKDIEDIIVLLDGCEALMKEFDETEGKVKEFVRQWFQENSEELQDAVSNFLPYSSKSREEIVIELIAALT
jgi:hypothetical protein